MSSEAKVAANRRNAKKSTGPKYEWGKAVVARNAIRHGLFARQDVISGEDPAEYEQSRRNILAELRPVGHIETELGERIVSLLWRLERAQWLQKRALDYLLAKEINDSLADYDDVVSEADLERMKSDPATDPRLIVGRVVVDDCLHSHVLDRLMLCEHRLQTNLSRAFRDLRTLRQEREADPTRECAKQSQPAVEAACSVPVRACEETPYGVTTNESDCAKQSQQDGSQLPVVGCQLSRGNPAGNGELRTVNSDPAPDGVTTNVPDCAKQSQESVAAAQPPSAGITAEGGRAPGTDTVEAACAEQSQTPVPGGSVKAEGLGDGGITARDDHRQAPLDDATPPSLPEAGTDRAKQSQRPAFVRRLTTAVWAPPAVPDHRHTTTRLY